MKPIRVDTTILNSQANELDRLQEELEALSDTIGSISSSLSWMIPGSIAIKGRLAAKQLQLSAQRRKAAALAAGLRKVSGSYFMTEFRTSGLDISKIREIIDSVTAPPRTHYPPDLIDWRDIIPIIGIGTIIGGSAAMPGFAPTDISYGEWKNDGAFNEKANAAEQEKKPVYQINKDEKWYEKSATILEAERQAKAEGSLKEYSAEGKAKYAQGSADAKFGTAEAHAKADMGLYVYEKDADGNTKRIFSPGVSAEVGASVALISASAEGRVGLGQNNDMLGLYGKGEVEAASAEAKAGVSINRNEIHAEARAEANLVKVEGSAGVTVLGADVGVSGSVKVGVGAHAEAGITDGKLKVDVGFAIGVGVDVGFEIDLGGMVKAARSLCRGLFHW